MSRRCGAKACADQPRLVLAQGQDDADDTSPPSPIRRIVKRLIAKMKPVLAFPAQRCLRCDPEHDAKHRDAGPGDKTADRQRAHSLVTLPNVLNAPSWHCADKGIARASLWIDYWGMVICRPVPRQRVVRAVDPPRCHVDAAVEGRVAHAAWSCSSSSSMALARSYLASVMVLPLSRSARTWPPPRMRAERVAGARSIRFASA